MKKHVTIFLLVALLSVVCNSLHSVAPKAVKNTPSNESEFLNICWFSDADELCMDIEFEDGLVVDDDYYTFRDKRSNSILGCEISLVPDDNVDVFSSSGEVVERITIEVSLDARTNPFEGYRTITTFYAPDEEGASRTIFSEKNFAVEAPGLKIDVTRDAKLYNAIDENKSVINECMIAFPLLKSGKKK